MDKQYGKREIKKAKLRIDLMTFMLEELKGHTFDQIKVTTLCEKAGISEVTFFKYFDKKEELLQYFMQVWNYRREKRIHLEGRQEGLAAIRQIFYDLGTTEHAIKILNTVSGFISKSSEPPKKIHLTGCEKWLLDDQETYDIKVMDLSDQITYHLKEIIIQGEGLSVDEIAKMNLTLSSLFYGTAIIAHATSQPLLDLYMMQLDQLFK